MGTYFDILDKENFDDECKGIYDGPTLNEKYGFVLKSRNNVFDWIREEIPELPYKDICSFFHWESCLNSEYEHGFKPEDLEEYAKFIGVNAQEKFKKLRKIAQEYLDYINEHKIELERSYSREVLEKILKIPVEEVYYLQAN